MLCSKEVISSSYQCMNTLVWAVSSNPFECRLCIFVRNLTAKIPKTLHKVLLQFQCIHEILVLIQLSCISVLETYKTIWYRKLGTSQYDHMITNWAQSHTFRLDFYRMFCPDQGSDNCYFFYYSDQIKCLSRSLHIIKESQSFTAVNSSRTHQYFGQEAHKNNLIKLGRYLQIWTSGLNNSFNKHFKCLYWFV